jgi:hypothetical protein
MKNTQFPASITQSVKRPDYGLDNLRILFWFLAERFFSFLSTTSSTTLGRMQPCIQWLRSGLSPRLKVLHVSQPSNAAVSISGVTPPPHMNLWHAKQQSFYYLNPYRQMSQKKNEKILIILCNIEGRSCEEISQHWGLTFRYRIFTFKF